MMNYHQSQSRSSRIKSLPRNDDSIYCSAIDTLSNSNVTDLTRSSSQQSISAHSRNYIDPWDLENYDYIRSMDSNESNPTSFHDDILNPYYLSNSKMDDCPCYAGLDEQLFYNAKYEMIPDAFTDMEDISSSSCSGSKVSTLRSHPQIHFPPPPMQTSSAYECYANVVVPKRRSVRYNNESMSVYHDVLNDQLCEKSPIQYPQPKYYYDQYAHGGYECIEMQNIPVYYAQNKYHDDYDIYSKRRHLERFGLSKKGLLQIDYSVSWMNLQRIISSK